MNPFNGTLVRVRLIAGNTFLEAARQKFFSAIVLISVALVVGARFFQQFDFGTGELKFITDFGFGAILFFGAILAIAATAQLFFAEADNRTALTLLAKPVRKAEFLVGKFAGAWLLMLAFVLLLCAVLAGVLYSRVAALEAADTGNVSPGELVRFGDVFLFGFLQWIKFGVVCASVLLIASFSNTNLYTVLMAFFVLLICQLQYIARDAYSGMEGLGGLLLGLVGWVFPNFQLFSVGDQMVYAVEDPLGAGTFARIALYGLAYVAAFLFLAQLSFRRREI